LTPLQPDNPALRIAKYPLEPGLWTNPGEPVYVHQSPDFFHPAILPDFLPTINTFFYREKATLRHPTLKILPTHFHDEPKKEGTFKRLHPI
jgi:hypothetical protein